MNYLEGNLKDKKKNLLEPKEINFLSAFLFSPFFPSRKSLGPQKFSQFLVTTLRWLSVINEEKW